jgi:hypothetical protein
MAKKKTALQKAAASMSKGRWAKISPKQRSRIMQAVRAGSAVKANAQ